jgi:hypothetical protein
MAISPKAAAEIKRLMLDPDALRDERAPSPGGRGHYDPNQPRVPAGDPRGGQFASKGYRGGDSGLDARVMQASLDAAQLVQFGRGNPRDAYAQVQPFDGQVGNIGAGQHLTSQNAFHERTPVTTSRATADGTDSGRQDLSRANASPAVVVDGLSRQPPMYTTTPQARTPQFRQLLRVQSSSTSACTTSWSSRQSTPGFVGDKRGPEPPIQVPIQGVGQ